jgi:hypothetical protein
VGQSIQQAIDQARKGAVICLSSGTYVENIQIKKSLTLRGAGRSQTVIKGKPLAHEDLRWPVCPICYSQLPSVIQSPQFESVVRIESVSEIKVNVQDLTIREAQHFCYFDSCLHVPGVWVGGLAKVIIQSSIISGNETGLTVGDLAQVILIDSRISNNESIGLLIVGSTQVKVQQSLITDNGTGIQISERVHLTLTDSVIKLNAGWGLVDPMLTRCGLTDYWTPLYPTSQVLIFEGENTIEGNNTSNIHNGKGNPGNHPFPNLPDGQVCLRHQR